MKKFISAFLIISLCISLVVSCTVNEETQSPEENLVLSIEEGLFYSPVISDEISKIRDEALAFFNSRLILLYNHTVNLRNSFNQLDELIFLTNTDISSSNYESLIKTNLAYKTKINALIEETNSYYSLAERDLEKRPIFQRKAMESLISLVNIEDEYFSWLLGTIEIFATGMSDEAADNLFNSFEMTFDDSIKEPYEDLIVELIFISDIYQKIISADYYTNLPKLQEYLSKTEDNEIIEILLKDTSKPAILIPLDSTQIDSTKKDFQLINKAYASTTIDEETYKEIGYSIFTTILLLKNDLQKVDESPDLDISYNDVIAENFKNIIYYLDANAIRSQYANQINNDFRNRIYRKPYSLGVNEEKQKIIDYFKNTALQPIDRQKLIDKIINGQKLGSFMTLMNSDDKFFTITNALKSFIISKNGIDYEYLETFQKNFNEKLIDLLGDQQEIFVEKLLSVEASKIADVFIKWQERNRELSEINISQEDLIALIKTLGLDVKKTNAISNLEVIDDYSGIYEMRLSIVESTFIEQEYRPDPRMIEYTIEDWNRSVANEINTFDPDTSQMNIKEHTAKIEIQHNKENNNLSFHFNSDLMSFVSSYTGYRKYENTLANNQWESHSTGGPREENETDLVLTFSTNENGQPIFNGTLRDYSAHYYTFHERKYNIEGVKIENLEKN